MITLRNVVLRRGVKVVLQNADITLNPGEKIGLVGRNGAGKSSLFSLLTGRLQPDAGDVSIPPTWRVGEVAQHMPECADSATDFVIAGDTPLMQAQEQLRLAEAADDGNAMAQAHMLIEECGGFDAKARAQALMLGLGFKMHQLEHPVNSFSGGWRMRLQLARALMCPADLLLLDEPTNHLDLDALVWLEAWLQRHPATMQIISHDREFLDAITRVTVHLEETQLTRWGGNYSAFEEMRAERMSQQQAAHARQQERIAHLQRFIDRFKAQATKARQAQSRVKALARMERIAPILTAHEFNFEFRQPPQLPNPMLSLRNLDCGYAGATPDSRGTVIVHQATRTLLAGQRIGVLGANGQGKSTLVKTIAGSLQPIAGQMVQGKGLRIGYFAQQEMDLLSPDDTPLQRMVRLVRELQAQGDIAGEGREQDLRNFLGQFRFEGDMVHQSVATLSGGERARLVLATLVWQRPNLLLLDEPTNHLDLNTREALSMALNSFDGSVLLVSHDRALLREVCDEFWWVHEGKLEAFDGDLDDYQKRLLEISRAQAASAKVAAKELNKAIASAHTQPAVKAEGANTSAPGGAVFDKKLQQQNKKKQLEIQRIEQQLTELQTEKQNFEAQIVKLSTKGGKHLDAITQLSQKAAAIQTKVDLLEEKWLELLG